MLRDLIRVCSIHLLFICHLRFMNLLLSLEEKGGFINPQFLNAVIFSFLLNSFYVTGDIFSFSCAFVQCPEFMKYYLVIFFFKRKENYCIFSKEPFYMILKVFCLSGNLLFSYCWSFEDLNFFLYTCFGCFIWFLGIIELIVHNIYYVSLSIMLRSDYWSLLWEP